MEPEPLVRRAAERDLPAFVELTRRFQHFAFGSALALVGDFARAEDVVQEAFLAAWSALPSLEDPAAFPGWLRSIVRHHAVRVLRRRHPAALPLTAAEAVPSDHPPPDECLDRRQRAALALAAIAELPAALREPAALFYVHDCSHHDIAVFLGLSPTTVNNRLHAARAKLQERVLTMIAGTFRSHGLPDDFANRIGRLVAARGDVVEALFDPQSPPDLLTELVVSDEANRRGVTVQVIQRPGGGRVRGIAVAPAGAMPRGATVLDRQRFAETPITPAAFARAVALLAAPVAAVADTGRLRETGIKVIDVMCPVSAGGAVAIAGELGTGTTVVMAELVRRLSGGPDRLALFTIMPPWQEEQAPGFSHAGELRKEGFGEGTVGAVQTFFLRGEDGPWTAARLAGLAPADAVIHLSREIAEAKIYPCVDVLTSRSRLIEAKSVGDAHVMIAARARHALTLLRNQGLGAAAEPLLLERARKLQNFFTQSFHCAEPWTGRPGVSVGLEDTLRGCAEILDGRHDDVPLDAFYFIGGIEECRSASPSRRVPEASA